MFQLGQKRSESSSKSEQKQMLKMDVIEPKQFYEVVLLGLELNC